MLVGVLVIVLGLGLACGLIWLHLRARRVPAELRGNWWPEFEREFWAYATRRGTSTRRHQRDRHDPPR